MGVRRRVISAALWLSAGLASAGAAGGTWSSLWLTPEQRAQRLLDSGHPREAAGLFADPRRRAYAALESGDSAEAARLLKPFHDENSEYNRGNALAGAGDLTAALAAYDAALEQAPGDRDARHNRDLVARALEQQSGEGSGQGGSQRQGSSGERGGSAQSERSGSKGSSGPAESGARSGSPGEAQAGSSPADRSATGGQDADQAERDAQLAARLPRSGAREGASSSVGGTANARGGESSGGVLVARGKPGGEAQGPPPKSEQTLALEQWLRRIPDDPGGLLRRKFLIEHIERQQAEEAEQAEQAGQAQGEDAQP